MITETMHRPWALPSNRWAVAMNWHDLLFMHWPIRSDLFRPLIPPTLEVDTFDGMAWIGVVPFRMTGVRPRYIPALPWLSTFLELNVRTYVKTNGKPGVWFFSLDAANPVAVRAARLIFHLPYFDAHMDMVNVDGGFRYRSKRVHRSALPADFAARYRPIGLVYYANPGTIDHWLTERYCLYATDRKGQTWRGEIHHNRWPLQPAEAEIETNTMIEPLGVKLPHTAPLLHFAQRLDVVAWTLTLMG